MATIAAGTLKNKNLVIPKGDVRTAQRMVRLAVFNFLDDFVKEASVLDLFAGAGTFGVEALSRGARKVVFVDIAEKSIQAIKENIASLEIDKKSAVYKMDAQTFLMKSRIKHRKFDIIFIDPPFTVLHGMNQERRDNYIGEIIDRAKDLLNEKSLIILKYPKKYEFPLPTGISIAEKRRYGINQIAYLVQNAYLVSL